MATPTDDDARREDALMRRVFHIAGRRPAADPAALKHAEDVFRRALAPVVERNRRHTRTRRYARWSMAAAFIAALGIALWLPRPSDPRLAEPVATLLASRGPVAVLGPGAGAQTPKGIHLGQVLMTGPDGRASLRYRDADVRLDVATTVRFDAARLVLERGAVYVDTGVRRPPGEPNVLIETRFGMVGHTGTQFVARVADDRLIVGVREGTVFVKGDTDRRDLSATPHGATIAEVGPSGVIDIREAPSFDGLWSWVPQLSEGFAADGRSVDAYLGWVSREYGYTVDYGDSATESRAKSTLLHGDLGGLPIDTALDAVGATTDLDVDLDAAGQLHVTSKRNHDADGRNERQ
jgi:ferric-dicitrate binding protein FerR (iron transport regulator)